MTDPRDADTIRDSFLLTLRGEDLDLRGHRGPAVLSATLITATSSSEGPWLLNVMTAGTAVGGMLE